MRKNPYDTFFREAFSDPETARELTQLSPIMPIVIYHGAKRWNEPHEFSDLVTEMTGEHIPHFRPVFINLASVDSDQITGSLRFLLGLVALKYVQQELERKTAQRLLGLFEQGRQDPATRDLARLAEQMYVQTRSREDIEHLTAMAAEAHYVSTEEDLMTYAEELLHEGQLQDKRNVLTRQLSRRFELTDSERDLIASSDDPDALDAALDEFAVATEKTSVLSKLRR